MAKRQRIPGFCRICGQWCDLTLEHVPPKEAYNKSTVIEYKLDEWITNRNIKGRQQQGGIAKYTLCESCNTITGSWYGGEYVKWSRIGQDILGRVRQHPSHFIDKLDIQVVFTNVYPLRYLKQVVTCFFSIVDSPQAEFSKNDPALVRFLLEKDMTDLPDAYRFYLRLYQPTQPKTILRQEALAGKITFTNKLQTLGASVFSELAHPPFMLVMTYDTDFREATEITYFKNFGYDDKVDLPLSLRISVASSYLPGSFQ